MTCPTCGRETVDLIKVETPPWVFYCPGCGTVRDKYSRGGEEIVSAPELVRLLIDDPAMTGAEALKLIGYKEKP
jgi:hypothetical protein